MSWKSLDQMDVNGRTVLVRVDINVPVEDGVVTDATRIARIVPTVNLILDGGGKPVLLAHFGRPKGTHVPDMSLRVVVPELERALGRKVTFADDDKHTPARSYVEQMGEGDVVLLENMRFYPGEEANDPAFAAQIASLGDIFCNDAFSAAHRAHASTVGIADHLPSCAGKLMEEELNALDNALGNPKRPVTAVVGGAKVSTKISLLANLLDKVDTLIIGGGMANTFLAAQGYDVGKSLCENDMTSTAQDIMDKAQKNDTRIVLPTDVAVAAEFAPDQKAEIYSVAQCPPDKMILDAGPDTVAEIVAVLESSATLVWNGPLGAFEIPPFDAATKAAASKAAELSQAGALVSVAGGGDTVAALNTADVAAHFSYVSTAGGAFLEWMEGKQLPGVTALEA